MRSQYKKSEKNHETIQNLTFPIAANAQMNSVNDSGEFQEVESNYNGRLSCVSSQLTIIPSYRSRLGFDKRLLLDTWNTSGFQENVFGNQISTFDSPRDHPQGIHSCATPRERGSVLQATGTETFFTRDNKQNRGTIPMPTFAGMPSIVSSSILVEFPQNSMVGQQRQQILELQFDKYPSPQSFSVWNNNMQKSSDCFF